MQFTIQHVVYVIKQSVSRKMFTNERFLLFSGYYLEIPLYNDQINEHWQIEFLPSTLNFIKFHIQMSCRVVLFNDYANS